MRRVENSVGKEKMLVTSIFSIYHTVFKKPVCQVREKSGLCGKELIDRINTFLYFTTSELEDQTEHTNYHIATNHWHAK